MICQAEMNGTSSSHHGHRSSDQHSSRTALENKTHGTNCEPKERKLPVTYQANCCVSSQDRDCDSSVLPSGAAAAVIDAEKPSKRHIFKSRRRARSSEDLPVSADPTMDPLEDPFQSQFVVRCSVETRQETRVTAALSCDSGYGDGAAALSPCDFGVESISEEIWTRSMPSVIVSDCSNPEGIETNAEDQSPLSTDSNASPVPESEPVVPWTWSHRDSLTLTLPFRSGSPLLRRLSDCSSCSSFGSLDVDPCLTPSGARSFFHVSAAGEAGLDDSTEQTCDCEARLRDSQDSQDPLEFDDNPACSKSSPWRKVRSAVQWSPFIQTFRRQRYPWVQLAGHQGNFKLGGEHGTILKKLCPKEEQCFKLLMQDPLRPFVPQYKGQVVSDDGECFIVLEDLLGEFQNPCVMDCKIGVRTYLEEELAKAKLKPKLRRDMYDKMVEINPEAPTEEEKQLRGVTKPRYMVWRETISSTATLGFRIEGIRSEEGHSSKDFKTLRSKPQLLTILRDFVKDSRHLLYNYIERLESLKSTLSISEFFSSHELIGSSLLFIHDKQRANVWMIDFAKTCRLPPGVSIDHRSPWNVGNHEDGYLIGLDNLIEFFRDLLEEDHIHRT